MMPCFRRWALHLSFPPGEELAKFTEHVVLLHGLVTCVGTLGRDDERHGIHAKAGYSELQPEAHDLQDLRLYLRICSIEIGLKVVNAVKVVLACLCIFVPRRTLYSREYNSFLRIFGLLLRLDIPVAVFRLSILASRLEPWMLI